VAAGSSQSGSKEVWHYKRCTSWLLSISKNLHATGGCLEELNDHARAFHAMLASLLSKLSSQYEGMKYSLGNAYEMTINVIENTLLFSKQFTHSSIYILHVLGIA
jgi:hypothetical protein